MFLTRATSSGRKYMVAPRFFNRKATLPQ